MSILGSIKHAIFGHETTAAADVPAIPSKPVTPSAPRAESSTAPAGPAASAAISVETLRARLTALSTMSPQQLNWQTSIVDLLKLVGLDPSYGNRKQLAHELGYAGDTGDSASMNVWFHKEIMDRLARTGGTVPDDLK